MYYYRKSSIHKGKQQERNKGTTKQQENTEITLVSFYLTKLLQMYMVKLSNQKTKSSLMKFFKESKYILTARLTLALKIHIDWVIELKKDISSK